MTATLSAHEIDQIAAEWAVRHCVGLTPEEQVAFDTWLVVDPRHVGAYAKAEAVLARLDRVGAAGAEILRTKPTMHVCETSRSIFRLLYS